MNLTGQQLPAPRRLPLPPGPAGTRETLRLMADLIRQGRELPAVRGLALTLTAGLPQKDYMGEVRRIHAFVRDRVRYVRDIRGVETLHTVPRLLLQRAGDCDDKTVLLAALAESIGHPSRLVAVGLTPRGYTHVYPEIFIRGAWHPAETTEPWALGRGPGKVALRMEHEI